MEIFSNNSFFSSQIQENIKEKILDLKNKPNNVINLSKINKKYKNNNEYDLAISTCQNYQKNLTQAKNLLKPDAAIITGFINNISFENTDDKINSLIDLISLPRTDISEIQILIRQEKYYMPIIEKDYLMVKYSNTNNLINDLKDSNLLTNNDSHTNQLIKHLGKTIIIILELIYFIAWRP